MYRSQNPQKKQNQNGSDTDVDSEVGVFAVVLHYDTGQHEEKEGEDEFWSNYNNRKQ